MQYIALTGRGREFKDDILQEVNDQLIISFERLHVLIKSKEAGEKVKLTVLRQGSEAA